LEISGNFRREISGNLFQSFRKFPESFQKFLYQWTVTDLPNSSVIVSIHMHILRFVGCKTDQNGCCYCYCHGYWSIVIVSQLLALHRLCVHIPFVLVILGMSLIFPEISGNSLNIKFQEIYNPRNTIAGRLDHKS